MCGELKYPDLVMKIGYENTDSVCLRIFRAFPWLFVFLFACFGFFGMRDCSREEIERTYSVLVVACE
jgi:hypothetical protein